MAQSKCIKCDNTRFELKETEPMKAAHKYNFVQCTQCGGVVGVVEFFNTGDLLAQIGHHLKVPGF